MLVQFVAQPYDYSSYLQDRRGVEADAFMTLASPVFARDRQQIHQALLRLKLPSIGAGLPQSEAGYLMSLGSNIPKVAKRVADIGVRILAGTKASSIAVEQAEDAELVINAGTAQALGLKIPDSLRARAARIIA